ncbi:MAG: phenylalanine--tRNA ligase subunit beta [Wenyingzhuangia sp.]|uniref:phenylalanine--tRNA ligase subunit beta n=1 Tax=Wenyingzhuangia sp. TaxID=1964193 RepID=UPI00321B60F3
MKISYNWLKQFIKIDWEAEKTGELLTDLGLEVEGIEKVESIKGSLAGVVVGEVMTCAKHPNADKLSVTMVNIGEETSLQVVCGAPNIAAGQKVPVATVGTVLYDAQGEGFKIKKGKIRGEESHGMICAEDELSLGNGHDGILVLDNDLLPGTPVAEVFDIEIDEVFEIGLTPNRADAMSHLGVARDLRAGLMQQGIQKELISPSVSDFHVFERALKFDIVVEDFELAPKYTGLTLKDVKVADSPEWLQNKLRAIGVNPTNNVVDITNYVMHELGQPLHAFDAGKILGKKVVVTTLDEGTKFTTLDGIERILNAEDLMICDAEKTPLCIAGVLGGLHSSVSENTTTVFLEAAYFNPVSVRKTAKRHALNTDASFRFERGIDPNLTKYALIRAALMIEEIAGGQPVSDVDVVYPNKIEDFEVFMSYENVARVIGQNLPNDTIKNILASLEIKINSETEGGLGLVVPAYRVDVQREADIVEEILRVYGYNNIEFSHKLNSSIESSRFDGVKLENTIAEQLRVQGFNETMANSLTKPSYVSLSDDLKSEHNVEILNPLSGDLAVMRQSLLFSGLESVSYNINRKNNDIKFYEFGKTYHKYNDTYEEKKHLTLFVSGNRDKESWNVPAQNTDFYYLKSLVNGVLERLGHQKVKVTPTKSDMLSEGITFALGKMKIVDMGMVNPKVLKEFGIKQQVFYADFDWDTLLKVSQSKKLKVKSLPKYPSVKRDLALLLDQGVAFKDLYHAAFQSEKSLLKEVDLFDVYDGDQLPKGKKSYALSFVLQDENKTLEEKQIEKIMNKLQNSFEKQFNASLR